jgi:hypothetical protein
MGLFAPGFKDLGEIMRRMQRGLDAEAERFGMLGCSHWVAMERDYANSICFIMYFQAEKYVSVPSQWLSLTVSRGLQDFARSKLHKDAYMWWSRNGDKYPYIHMWQETYVSPPGHWRSSHTNGAPTLLRE